MDHQRDKKNIISSLLISGGLLALMWLVHFLIWVSGIDKTIFSNMPRQVEGLMGIFTSPLVHDDLWHLFSNSGPLFMFTAAILYFYRKAAFKAGAIIWVLSGIWVWGIAHPGWHIGASGVVYGFGAFLFFSGVFRREPISISVSLFIAAIYGSMVWGIMPGKPGISWESHLFGLIAGAVMAWHFRKVGVHPKKKYSWDEEPENDAGDENAVWNYRQNWTGSQNIIYPGHESEGEDQN